MTSHEAKQILAAYRPGREESPDAGVLEALELARRDPALQQWLEQQHKFHRAVENTLRQTAAPADLRDRIVAEVNVITLPWWKRPAAWAAAAAVLALLVAASVWFKPKPDDAFATFRSRMVRTVLRQYAMDLETNDMAVIRQFLAAKNAPSDYVLPETLAQMPATGAGVLSWQGERVSMVCLDSGPKGTLFLFVVSRASFKQPPPATAEFAQVNKLMTASWSAGDKLYVLAGAGDKDWLRQYR